MNAEKVLKTSLGLFRVNIDKIILKCIWKFKGSRITKTNFKKNEVRELASSDFKTYDKATVIKTLWYWLRIQTRRPME